MYARALELRQDLLGERHPQTLTSLNNLAFLYQSQGRHGEAEPLFARALALRQELLGARHPDTLQSLNNLAWLYESQGRYGEAEPLYARALALRQEVLGERHPDTLLVHLKVAVNLLAQEKVGQAVGELRRLHEAMLGWVGGELYATQQASVRRQLLLSRSSLQDVVITVGIETGSAEAAGLAADMVLQWKQVQGEEEGFLHRLIRRTTDTEVRRLGQEIQDHRQRLTGLARGGAPADYNATLKNLEESELALARRSRDFQDHLQVQAAGLSRVRAAVPRGAVLIDFRVYRPADFKTGMLGEPRLAALLLHGGRSPAIVDVASLEDVRDAQARLTAVPTAAAAEGAERAAYTLVFGKLDKHVRGAATVYLAPDGPLNLMPFGRLRLADGRYWIERQTLRLLQSGRDLIPPQGQRTGHGLVAFEGITFDQPGGTEAASVEPAPQSDIIQLASLPGEQGAYRSAAAHTGELFGAFGPLPASEFEIDRIGFLYGQARPGEPVSRWRHQKAHESRLKTLFEVPRVLHLATHGFYATPGDTVDRPMLLSGVTLAGANRGLKGELGPDGEDGILYSLEVMGLNLDGTELVVLSACDTAQGVLDYTEGVYGLVRAFRIAGAKQVLMTLWKLKDGEAFAFMDQFYKTWLEQPVSDPAEALRQTQLAYINSDDPAKRDPRVWAPYVVVGR